MIENRRFRWPWSEDELVVVIDMYYNFGQKDSHGHDAVARCLGRYNSSRRRHDGAINEKLAEITGYVDETRKERHPGAELFRLVDKYKNNQDDLRRVARAAWRRILQEYGRPAPEAVRMYVE